VAFREAEERVAIGRVDLSAIANRVEPTGASDANGPVCKCVSACKKRAAAAAKRAVFTASALQ